MKAWKLAVLVMSGGVLLQASSCVTDIAYYVLQAAASQFVSSALTGATA